MHIYSMNDLRHARDPVGVALASIFGAGLLIVGASWLAVDRSVWILAVVFVFIGLAALPPVTTWLRQSVNFGSGVHAIVATAILASGCAWAIAGPTPSSLATHFASTVQASEVVAPAEAWTAESDIEHAKADCLRQIAEASKSLAQGVDAASFSGDSEAVMAGLRTFANWGALSSKASTFVLTSDEQAQVDAFSTLAEQNRAALAPALRRAYADMLRNALSGYGVTAEVAGEQADTIHVIGYALNDQSVLAKVRALLSSDLQALGYTKIEFVAAQQGEPAQKPADATVGPVAAASSGPSL